MSYDIEVVLNSRTNFTAGKTVSPPYPRGSGGNHSPQRVKGRALAAGGIAFPTSRVQPRLLPAALHDPHEGVDQPGGGEIGGVQPRRGSELHHVEPEHLPTGKRPLRDVERLIPAEPAGHRSSRRGHDRRIKPVHVERQINPIGKIRRQKHFRQTTAGDVRRVVKRDAVLAPRLHLFKRQGPNAELRQRQPQILHGPAHDAGVAPRAALVGVAQIRMGVELNDPERPETLL